MSAYNLKYTEGQGFVAFDKDNNKLFIVYPFDNGPDYPSEGFFRIIEDNKVGFADVNGSIAIAPQFDAALPFKDGLAAYCQGCSTIQDGEHIKWEGGKWGFVDSSGRIVIEAQYEKVISSFENGIAVVAAGEDEIRINKKGEELNVETMKYFKWVELLESAVRLSAKLNEEIDISISWKSTAGSIQLYNDGHDFLALEIFSKNIHNLLTTIFIIPWQNFGIVSNKNDSLAIPVGDNLFTVTDFAVIYQSFSKSVLNENENNLLTRFINNFKELIEYNQCQTSEELESLKIPEGIQIISYNVYHNYIDLQIAQPGSSMPDPSEWSKVSEYKMLFLHVVPDMGEIRTSWIAPSPSVTDTYYTSVEDELIEIFNSSLNAAGNNRRNRIDIYEKHSESMRSLFIAANSYVNFLFDKYDNRLKKWLLVEYDLQKATEIEYGFADYQPKLTPDTALDYMPEANSQYMNLPDADISNLIILINLFSRHKTLVAENAGQWEDGNLVLGAREKEYAATLEELILDEIGERIKQILSNNDEVEVKTILSRGNITRGILEYNHFTFIHYDVMGSGRFFYIDSIRKLTLDLP